MKQFFNIDRRKNESIISQIIDQTISYINDYKLIHGSKLPHLKEAQIEFGLSDEEIKSILDSLVQLGYLQPANDPKQFIVQKPSKDSTFLVDVSPLFRSIENLGMKAKITTIKEEYISVDHGFASISGFKFEEKVYKITRIYYGNDRPLVYGEMYFSLDQLPGVDKYIVPHEPHQDVLFKQFPLAFKYHLRELNVISTPEHIQTLLKLTEKDPINTVGRYHFYNLQAMVVEFGVVHLLELNEFTTRILDLSSVQI